MEEFESKNYSGARSTADQIKGNAQNIMGIFEDIDRVMNELYGENYQSTGADTARDRYNQIRTKYEVFYNDVINMNQYIHTTTTRYEEADAAASNTIASV